MTKILTLVSGAQGGLYDTHFSLLNDFNIDTSTPHWVQDNTAAQFNVGDISLETLGRIRDVFNAHKIDIFLTEAKNAQKKLLIADMDSTIVEGETLDDLAEHAGVGDKVAAITARAMNGEINFHDAIRERVGLLKGMSVDVIKEVLEKTYLNPGAKELVAGMKAQGAKCVLVSGGFTVFTSVIADMCGFDAHHGNTLEIKDGKLTGRVIEPILDKHAKVDFMHKHMEELGIGAEDVAAIGDGANDVPLLLGAGLGVGYYAKPTVQKQVGNVINHADLRALLFAQGIGSDVLEHAIA